jgi:uncharacterized protein (TIGR03437 family)
MRADGIDARYHEHMRFVLFFVTTLVIAGDFTTSLGDMYPYMISAITTDAAGNTYVVGSRQTGGSLIDSIGNPSGSSVTDVFVSKLDPSGNLLFTDTFAGKGVDQGIAIAVDPSGNIYIAGTTTSNDFPLSKALQAQPGTGGTGFIIKLTNDGSTILYSTYFGGLAGSTTVNALTTDASGNLYLTGDTSSTDFTVTAGMPSATQPEVDYPGLSKVLFVAAISSAGDRILFSGTMGDFNDVGCPAGGFGCSSTTSGTGIALDASRNVYFGGDTNGYLASTPGALVPKGLGAFVGKIAANGSGLVYLTYLGSAEEFGPLWVGATQLCSFAVDSAGNVYLAGTTGDPNFPATPGAYQTAFAGGPVDEFGYPKNTDGFVAKLRPDGSAFVWATYLGGSGNDAVTAIAVDAAGNVWASGTTISPSFPNAQGWTKGGDFLVEFNPAGSALSYSALYPAGTVEQSVALDPSGLVHVAGVNGFVSAIAPHAAPSMKIFDFGNAFGGATTARISPAEVISIYGPGIGSATAASATPVSGFYSQTFSGVQVQINGMNMPLLYVSANQINAVVPMEVNIGGGATVRVLSGTAVSPAYPVWIVEAAPQAFPTVLNQDGTVNSRTNPAHSGGVITFYATGWQSFFDQLADGQVAIAALSVFSGNCCVAIQGVSSAAVLYAGDAPGIVAGVSQFNVQLGTVSVVGQVGFSVNALTSAVYQVNQSVWLAP